MVGLILNDQISPRGDMNSYAENFAHEDYFMQQARTNGQEIGAADPTAAVGNFLKFAVNLVNAKAVVEIGTGSGVGGLWLLSGMSSDAVLTTIDSEREHSKISRTVFEDADISPTRYRIIPEHLVLFWCITLHQIHRGICFYFNVNKGHFDRHNLISSLR